MSSLSTETFWRRRQLKHFLDAEPIRVRVARSTYEQTDSGGRRKTGETILLPQRFRIIPFKRRLTVEYDFSSDGEQLKNIHYILLADPDADVEIGDYFEHEGAYYEVKFVSKRNLDRKAIGVVTRDP